jgi:cell division protein FtsW
MTGTETLEAVLKGPLAGQRPWRGGTFGADLWLSLAVAMLVAIGAVMVLDVSYFHAERHAGDPYFFFRKHVASIIVGLLAAYLVSLGSSDLYRRLAYPAMGLALLSLALVLIPGIGTVRGGAQRWMIFGGMSVQPSEVAKLALVLYLACSLARKRDRMASFMTGILPHCVTGAVMAVLLVVEPDFGSAALVLTMVAVMLFAGEAPVLHLATMGVAAVPVLIGVLLAEGYRFARIRSFLYAADVDPLGVGFQLHQSLIAFGSGGVTGLGLGESQQKLFFLPAAHTDFIFSVIGEELGLVGGLAVLAAFGVVAVRGLRVAARHQDPFARLLACGLTVLIVLQALLNVGVVLGCLPTKGLALPFISYGGSAMLLALVEVGMLLALAREAR